MRSPLSANIGDMKTSHVDPNTVPILNYENMFRLFKALKIMPVKEPIISQHLLYLRLILFYIGTAAHGVDMCITLLKYDLFLSIILEFFLHPEKKIENKEYHLYSCFYNNPWLKCKNKDIGSIQAISIQKYLLKELYKYLNNNFVIP